MSRSTWSITPSKKVSAGLIFTCYLHFKFNKVAKELSGQEAGLIWFIVLIVKCRSIGVLLPKGWWVIHRKCCTLKKRKKWKNTGWLCLSLLCYLTYTLQRPIKEIEEKIKYWIRDCFTKPLPREGQLFMH